jgi:3-oxoacyl-[acyl-carrier protein] reductase
MRIFITGAASGIGRHLTGALARLGHAVVAADVNQDGVAAARAADGWPESVITTYLDVTQEHDWGEAFDLATQRLGGIDVLLNVAGFLRPGFLVDITAADIDRHMMVNVKGVVLGTREAARRMVAAKNAGHIVNFGSLASLSPVPGLALYCASKWAVRGFSLSVAVELQPHGIAITLVCPDAVETPMLDLQKDREEAALTFSGSRPLTVAEIERAIVEQVLPKRPLEITLPLGRGIMARAAGVAPVAAQMLYPMLKKKGAQGQRRSSKS